jgi:hypothetical protein
METVVALARTADGANILWTNPSWKNKNQFLGGIALSNVKPDIDAKDVIYIGIRAERTLKEIPPHELYVAAGQDLVGYLRWARWRFTEVPGIFAAPVVPGERELEDISRHKTTPEISLWGYGYFPHEHKEEYREAFFGATAGQVGPPPDEIKDSFPGQSAGFWDNLEPLYWIQMEFDRHIPVSTLKKFEFAATNCVIAINAHYQKRSYFYHGPGPMTLELEAPADQLYVIKSVDDNLGREYQNVYSTGQDGDPQCRYAPRIDDGRLKLLVAPPPRGPVPDRFSVLYRTSIGAGANGIGPGLIDSQYNPLPGIEAVTNLTESRGGVLARSFEEMVATFPQVLRTRNRAIVAADFEALAMAFDSRIQSARARAGSTVRNGCMTRCLELEVDLGNFRFVPDDEGRLFAARLERHLEQRSTVGTVVAVKLI